MDRPFYEFEYSFPYEVYSFTSEGKNGRVKKRVQFDLMEEAVFNLGFGDWEYGNEGFDDLAITDNGDMEKVLSTVIRIAIEFLSFNPGATIYVTGSTTARTRLYRVIISNRYDVISKDFLVLGYLDGRLHQFKKNVNYEAFLISKLL